MATRTATVSSPPRLRTKQFTWTGVAGATNDVGSAIDVLGYSSVLLSAVLTTAGSGSRLNYQGSHDGSNWFLIDTINAPETANTVLMRSLTVLPRYVRPQMTAGTTVATITALAR